MYQKKWITTRFVLVHDMSALTSNIYYTMYLVLSTSAALEIPVETAFGADLTLPVENRSGPLCGQLTL